MKILCIIISIITLQPVHSVKFIGSAEPDFIRQSYIQLEKSLWEKYVDKLSTLTNNERLYKIFNQHLMFIKQYVDIDYNEENFKVLSRYYEWATLEPDVKSIHMLFRDHFKRRLELDLETTDFNSVGFDKQANLDLAETILEDPLWPINATLEKIQTHIYNQGMYYKAISVRSVSVFFFIIEFYFAIKLLNNFLADECNHCSLQEASITLCTAQRSPQQVLYQLYNAITMTELKGYAMMQFSYMLLKTYGKG